MSKRCSAKNRDGKRCGAWAVTGATQCALHSDPKRAAEMGSKHGRRGTLQSRPDVLDAITPAPRTKIEEEVLEHEFMSLALSIDEKRDPEAKRRALISAAVFKGILESGDTRRVIPLENTQTGASGGPYTSLFKQLSLPAATAAPPAPAPLFPKPPEVVIPAGTPLPPVGESIDESAKKPPANSHIVHVEIEE